MLTNTGFLKSLEGNQEWPPKTIKTHEFIKYTLVGLDMANGNDETVTPIEPVGAPSVSVNNDVKKENGN